MQEPVGGGAPVPARSRVGLCTFSSQFRWNLATEDPIAAGFHDAAGFLAYARSLGAEGVQAPLRAGDDNAARRVRDLIDAEGLYYEGDLRLPEEDEGIDRFLAELRLAREAGAKLVRSYFMLGRRYEQFAGHEEFQQFRKAAEAVLQRVEPVLRRERMLLAMENHKDLTAPEFVGMLKLLGSEWIGVQVDTGNNIALLEDPYAVVEALAPYALSVHLKDIAVEEAEDGFLLSEVVFGEGLLDLSRMAAALRTAKPGIAFNVEMATRDPLRVPCLTARYWTTFPERAASDFATRWTWIRNNPPKRALPGVSGLGMRECLQLEEENNRQCIGWVRELGLLRPCRRSAS